MSDEEPPDQLSRRAQRRAARQADAKQEASGEDTSRSGSAAGRPKKKAQKKSGAKKSTQSIRDEARRQREAAAARRRSKRDKERRVAVAQGLDATEMVDDALARATHQATQWLKRHFAVIQWVLVGGLALGIGWSIYSLRQSRSEAHATDELMTGARAEFGKLPTDDVNELAMGREGPSDPRPEFESDEKRLEAALDAYRKVAAQYPEWDGEVLAELGAAGVLYDSGKYADALTKYQAVRDGKAAKSDFDLRARAIEGLGMCQEALKKDDAALKTYQELENFDVAAYRPLGMYHKARVLRRQGKKDQATELVKKAFDKLVKDTRVRGRGFVLQVVRDMLQELDPAGLAESERMALQKQLEALAQAQKAQTGGGKPAAPGGNAPAGAEQLKDVLKQLGKSAPPPPATSGSSAPAAPGTSDEAPSR